MVDKIEKDVLEKRKLSRDNQTQDDMRKKISFTKTLSSINDAENVLLDMIKEPDTTSAQVGVINALLNSKWKKMDRLLPVLKALEVQNNMNIKFKKKELVIDPSCQKTIKEIETLSSRDTEGKVSHLSVTTGYVAWLLNPLKRIVPKSRQVQL